MKLQFSKMHGLGNDFVVFDAINQQVELSPEQLRFLADRRFGIGCDQILLVETPRHKGTDFYYRIFNADGSEVEQCGNGARCFARFVHNHGLSCKNEIPVGTARGDIRLYLQEDGQVKVNMGMPVFEPGKIPFIADEQQTVYQIDIGGPSIEAGVLSMGNPHAVLQVSDQDSAPVDMLGPILEKHSRFPQRVNVGFMQIHNRHEISLRVFERGAGETLACGTGACAAVVSGRQRQLLDEEVIVHLRGGDLVISWKGEGEPVWMTGSATEVFQGSIEL
ncbi:diaminopimelate epimerase [Thiolapillus brandeum]|uniref:Diaminopimelate epimerase n=1 Tax=Thiolapillus brandeum TaxID=1076588 RepID=A0A7U6GGQ3_9GAMM|nr:diaminopimelate epimerase [Thiolapillus brandeum]BAO43306.1 diaminopimelate epimerase [Thiolapillus brandeum]